MKLLKLEPGMGCWEGQLVAWGHFKHGCDLKWRWSDKLLTIGWN